MSPLHLLKQLIARSGGHSQVKMMGHANLIGDLHVFEHVLDGKVRFKIVLDHFGHFHCQSRGIAGVAVHGFDETVE